MQALIPKLLEEGHEIIGYDIKVPNGKKNYEYHLKDLRFPGAIQTETFDMMIHAAAQIYGIVGFHRHGAEILRGDIAATNETIRASYNDNNNARYIFMSSSMVYERVRFLNAKAVSEQMPFDWAAPRTGYGFSKYAGERMLIEMGNQYPNFKYTILRPFNIITPYEKAHEEQGISHVFADFIEQIAIKKQFPLKIISPGTQVRCFTWIEDVVKMMRAVISDPSPLGNGIYNLGNKEPISMFELAKMIHRISIDNFALDLPKHLEFAMAPAIQDDVMSRIPDVAKFTNDYGFQASVDTEEAIETCIRYRFENP